MISEEDHLLTIKKSKEDYILIKDVKEIQELETTRSTLNQYSNTIEESEDDFLSLETDSSLERSIWVSNKDRYKEKENIKAKVVAIKVFESNANYRENH